MTVRQHRFLHGIFPPPGIPDRIHRARSPFTVATSAESFASRRGHRGLLPSRARPSSLMTLALCRTLCRTLRFMHGPWEPSSPPPLQLAKRLEEMPEAEFRSQVEELAKAKLERPKRLREAAGRDWGEIEPGLLRCGARLPAPRGLRQLCGWEGGRVGLGQAAALAF